MDELVAFFLSEMGLEGHQAIYGLHNDTRNYHVHIAVNRVHPETLKVVRTNNGFDIRMHSIYRYMHMIISGVVVQPVNCLMSI